MKAVFAASQLGHAPTRFLSMGEIIDYPEAPERARRLLQGARAAGAQIYAARRYPAAAFETIHSKPYINFLETAFEEFCLEPNAGPELMPSLRPMLPPTVPPKHILARAGAYMMDFSCPIVAGTWRSVAASAMTAITAADVVVKGERTAYALCRPPGHHAYADRAGGFCYLNNSALAAQHLREMHDRVAILDVDVHHGNGTQSIFYNRGDVLTISIHADPGDFYPFYWGYAEEKGEGEGEGCNLNLPVPVGSGDDVWLQAVNRALDKIQSYSPGALVVALGLDAHEEDPLQGGAVTTAGFAQIAEEIASLNLPSVIVQEGGYMTDHLADNLAMFLSGFEGGSTESVYAEAG